LLSTEELKKIANLVLNEVGRLFMEKSTINSIWLNDCPFLGMSQRESDDVLIGLTEKNVTNMCVDYKKFDKRALTFFLSMIISHSFMNNSLVSLNKID